MEAGLPDAQKRELERLSLLKAVYDLVDGDTTKTVLMAEAYGRAGLSWDDGQRTLEYLEAEGLLEQRTVLRVGITHDGVRECEEASAIQPNDRTEHFPATVIIQAFHGPIGYVQTGGQGNVADVTQTTDVKSGDV